MSDETVLYKMLHKHTIRVSAPQGVNFYREIGERPSGTLLFGIADVPECPWPLSTKPVLL